MILTVYGDDGVRVKDREDEFRKHFVEKYDAAGMNTETIAPFTSWEAVREAVFAAPFLAEKRLVVVRGAHGAVTKAQVEWVTEILSQIPSSTVLLLSDVVDTKDWEKGHLATALKSASDIHHYPLLTFTSETQATWLLERSKKLGLLFAPDAWREFLRRVGSDLTRAVNELAKCHAYAGGETLTLSAVQSLVSPAAIDGDPFFLANALDDGARAGLDALTLERRRGSNAFALYGSLTRALRIRYLVSLADQAFLSPEQLGLHPFVVQKTKKALRVPAKESVRSQINRAIVLDQAMKKGLDPDLAVDRLTFSFPTP